MFWPVLRCSLSDPQQRETPEINSCPSRVLSRCSKIVMYTNIELSNSRYIQRSDIKLSKSQNIKLWKYQISNFLCTKYRTLHIYISYRQQCFYQYHTYVLLVVCPSDARQHFAVKQRLPVYRLRRSRPTMGETGKQPLYRSGLYRARPDFIPRLPFCFALFESETEPLEKMPMDAMEGSPF